MIPIYFTSDLHWGHAKMATLRGFETPAQMNEKLIENWNAKVPKNAEVYVLGDFSFMGAIATREIIGRLNGRIALVPGNHDSGMNAGTLSLFDRVLPPLKNIKVNRHLEDGTEVVQHLVLCHFPLLVWDKGHYGAWHLHGHCHGRAQYPNPNARIVDVGIDGPRSGLSPLSFDDIAGIMKGRGFKPLDQHEEPAS